MKSFEDVDMFAQDDCAPCAGLNVEDLTFLDLYSVQLAQYDEHNKELKSSLIEKADKGDALAQMMLGVRTAQQVIIGGSLLNRDGDLKEALSWLEKAKQNPQQTEHTIGGVPFWLGRCYSVEGTSFENQPKAIAYFNEAANNGHPAAQYELGKRFLEGRGVNKNIQTSKYWLEKVVMNPQCDLEKAKELLVSDVFSQPSEQSRPALKIKIPFTQQMQQTFRALEEKKRERGSSSESSEGQEHASRWLEKKQKLSVKNL